MKSILCAISYAFLWVVIYALPWIGAAGMLGIPISHIWFDSSWWWMTVPVSMGVVWILAVILMLDQIGG
jgi:hypothetical protein